ncbi:MAG: ABC transporter ATP-binding protein [Chloroflexi bacterium]|nr:ABC transporter ATP-binding protein [Chloroflexota bacterium]
MYWDWRLFRMTEGVRGRVWLAALIGIIAVPVAIWRLTLTGVALSRVFQGRTLGSIAGLLLLIATLIVLRAALQFLKDEIAHGTAAIMKVRVRRTLYDHVLQLGPGHFDQRRTGDAVLSLVEGVESLDTFFGLYLPQIIIALLTPIIIFAFMAFLDVRTATVFLVFAFATLVAPALFHRANRNSSMARRISYAALGSDFLDSMQGLPTLKAFGQSGRRGAMLAERARNVYRATMWLLAVNIGTGGITLLGISAGAAVALSWGAVRVDNGTLELQTLLVVLLLGVEVFRPLRDLTVLYHAGMVAVAATRGIYDLLDAVPEVAEPGVGNRESGVGRGGSSPTPDSRLPTPSISFENVTFGYQSGKRPALTGLSFELRPGETLGVVGPSGAGKSTIVNLALRFVDPQDGRVMVGGQDVRDVPFEALRRHIAVVSQDTYLFHGTVAENLRLGKPAATQAELEEAARNANAHDFIAAMTRGYETIVGERGTRLSGGQRQRIAIARALLKDAPILVLDEALSSVDAENERVIQQALDRLQRGRTTLVIAHRLSSVVGADRIIVLERGRQVENGTHADLMRAGGVYARLMAAQHEIEEERGARSEEREEDAAAPAPRSSLLAPSSTPGEELAKLDIVQRVIPRRELWRRLLRLVGPWWWEAALTLVIGLANSISTVLLGVAGALLVGRAATGGDITPFLIFLLAMVPVSAIFTWLDSWIAHDLAFRLLAEMRIALYRLLDPLAPAYLQRRRSGDLVSAATGDIELIELFYAHTISPAFQAVLVPGGVLIVLALLSPLLALVLLPFLVGVALTPLLASGPMERLGGDLRGHTGDMNAHMVDSVQGLRTIAAFTHGPARAEEVAANGVRMGHLKRAFMRSQALQNGTIEALTGLGGLAVLTVGAELVADGSMSRTRLPLATLLAVASFAPVVNIVTVAKELMQTVASSRRYFAIEDEPVLVQDGPGVMLPAATSDADRAAGQPMLPPGSTLPAQASATGASVPRLVSGDGRHESPRGLPVAFDHVTFRYAPQERPALSDVSFEMDAGQTVALVGRSGAGKTTAAHLLLRFWDPQDGRIMIAGHNLRDFAVDDLRGLVALVAQDTYLFNNTLWENLKLGRVDATDEEIMEAARRANVDEFASVLPDGYETMVGERGMQLSGGQRQRVAIARALLKDAPILVLDEATSHLDAVNEAEVRGALDRLMAGRTTLVIAHRLSTIRAAAAIIVLDDGRVAEQGTHYDLLAKDGLYSHLIASQLMAGARARVEQPTVTAGDD